MSDTGSANGVMAPLIARRSLTAVGRRRARTDEPVVPMSIPADAYLPLVSGFPTSGVVISRVKRVAVARPQMGCVGTLDGMPRMSAYL